MFPRDAMRKDDLALVKYQQSLSLADLREESLGACLDSRCSILGESDSILGDEQVFSPLEYRSDAASAAECAGFRAERPCLTVYRWAGTGEPRSQADQLQLCKRAWAAAV